MTWVLLILLILWVVSIVPMMVIIEMISPCVWKPDNPVEWASKINTLESWFHAAFPVWIVAGFILLVIAHGITNGL